MKVAVIGFAVVWAFMSQAAAMDLKGQFMPLGSGKMATVDEGELLAINKRVNKVKYVSDIDNYKKKDYWAAPDEFYQRGGDCEDYAIAKMMALVVRGVPESDLMLMVGKRRADGEMHAVLEVRLDGKEYVLDNNETNIVMAKDFERSFEKIYRASLDGTKLVQTAAGEKEINRAAPATKEGE